MAMSTMAPSVTEIVCSASKSTCVQRRTVLVQRAGATLAAAASAAGERNVIATPPAPARLVSRAPGARLLTLGCGTQRRRRVCTPRHKESHPAAHLRELLVHAALVLREDVQNAARGRGVEKRERRAQHGAQHLAVEARRRGERETKPAQVARQREQHNSCTHAVLI